MRKRKNRKNRKAVKRERFAVVTMYGDDNQVDTITCAIHRGDRIVARREWQRADGLTVLDASEELMGFGSQHGATQLYMVDGVLPMDSCCHCGHSTDTIILDEYLEAREGEQVGPDPVNFLLAVPISESERQYASQNGSEALEELFSKRRIVPVVDETRKSLV